MDDLNLLFHRQGVARFAADTAGSQRLCDSHRREAAHLALAIAAFGERPSPVLRRPLLA